MCLASTRHLAIAARYGLRRAAVTIVELVIVVLMMSVFAAVAVPTFVDSLLFHRVESAARRVKADLELARQTARLTSATQSVTFTGSAYTLSAAVTDLDGSHDQYVVDLAAPPFELDGVTPNFGGGTLVFFDGYAVPSRGGTIVLRTGGHQCTVALDGATGEVTITSNHTRGRTALVVGN